MEAHQVQEQGILPLREKEILLGGQPGSFDMAFWHLDFDANV